jgi:hypothetical protein
MTPRLVVLIALAMVVALLAAQPRLDGEGEPEKALTIHPGAAEEPAAPAETSSPPDLGRGGLPFPEPRRVVVKLRGGLPLPEVTATLVSVVTEPPPPAPAPVLVSAPASAAVADPPPSEPDPPPEPDPPAAQAVVPSHDDDGGYDDDDGFDDDDGSSDSGSD